LAHRSAKKEFGLSKEEGLIFSKDSGLRGF